MQVFPCAHGKTKVFGVTRELGLVTALNATCPLVQIALPDECSQSILLGKFSGESATCSYTSPPPNLNDGGKQGKTMEVDREMDVEEEEKDMRDVSALYATYKMHMQGTAICNTPFLIDRKKYI